MRAGRLSAGGAQGPKKAGTIGMGDFGVNAAGGPEPRPLRPVRRWAARLAATVSAALFIAAVGSWVDSYWHYRSAAVGCGTAMLVVNAVRGHVVLDVEVDRRFPPAFFLSFGELTWDWDLLLGPANADLNEGISSFDAHWLYDRPWRNPLGSVSHRVWLGFQSEVSDPPSRTRFARDFFVPDWFLAVACGALPMRAFRRWLTEGRKPHICRCHRCGYDLRATPGRCPECGAVPSVNVPA